MRTFNKMSKSTLREIRKIEDVLELNKREREYLENLLFGTKARRKTKKEKHATR